MSDLIPDPVPPLKARIERLESSLRAIRKTATSPPLSTQPQSHHEKTLLVISVMARRALEKR